MRRGLILLAALAVAATAPVVDPATGYRLADYRGVIPSPPPGVPQIHAAEVAKLVDANRALLIDVVPAEGGVRDASGRWRLATPHTGIPGSHWFPEAGRGKPDPAIASDFLAGVRRLQAGQPHATPIVFCLADCWMSWNAALRLRRAGVRHVRWFAEGADGWRDLGRPLIALSPYQDQP